MTLDFIQRDVDGRIENAWCPVPTGDYSDDIQIGRLMADRAVAYLHSTDDVPTFNRVMRDAGRAKQGAVEIGFMSRIASHLRRIRIEALSLTCLFLNCLQKFPAATEIIA